MYCRATYKRMSNTYSRFCPRGIAIYSDTSEPPDCLDYLNYASTIIRPEFLLADYFLIPTHDRDDIARRTFQNGTKGTSHSSQVYLRTPSSLMCNLAAIVIVKLDQAEVYFYTRRCYFFVNKFNNSITESLRIALFSPSMRDHRYVYSELCVEMS